MTEKIIEICKKNNIKAEGTIFKRNSEEIEKIIEICKKNNIKKAEGTIFQRNAEEITKALGAAVCGVDLIIPDYTKPATDSIHSWGVIEANFNPAMMIHIFPHHGKSRRVTRDVLKMLFPEVA